jgi:predicted phage tail protein
MRGLYALIIVVLCASPVAAQGSAQLAWDAGEFAAGYLVQVGTAPGATSSTVTLGDVLTTSLDFAAPGTYYLRVVAFNPVGASDASNEVSVAIAAPPPPPPPPPTDPCAAEPLAVVVTTWPNKKQVAAYYGSHAIQSVTWLTRKGNQVYGAEFIDIRGCHDTVIK